MTAVVYKWLNGFLAKGDFQYRLRHWTPPIEGNLVPCLNAYHGCSERHLAHWIESDLFVIESREKWFPGGCKLYTRGPVRIVEHLKWNERTARLFAADCAERVLPLWEREHPDDERPRYEPAGEPVRERHEGMRAAFALYWGPPDGQQYDERGLMYSVALWGSEAAYLNPEDDDWPGPFCEDGRFKWEWWRRLKKETDMIERLSREEIAALTRPARVRERDEKVAALERATRGLRVGVRVTPSLYRPRGGAG